MQLLVDKQSLYQAADAGRIAYNGSSQGLRGMLDSRTGRVESGRERGKTQLIHVPHRERLVVLILELRIKILLVLIWVLTLWWGEKYVFQSHISACQWSNWEKWSSQADPHHVVLLADPQLVDPHTYPDRPWPASSLTIRHTDQYLRRSFTALQRTLHPDTAFFLGDLFDGGREWSTGKSKSPDRRWNKYGQDFWLQEYHRFGEIFLKPWMRDGSVSGLSQNRKMIASLPGNHDLGIGEGIQIPVRDRFNVFFGGGNRIDSIGNHTFVSLDTVSLTAKGQSSEPGHKADKAIWEHTEQFLENIKEKKVQVVQRELRSRSGQPENVLQDHMVIGTEVLVDTEQQRTNELKSLTGMPTILLTHVPLFRDPGTPCGPLRERWPPSKKSDTNKPLQSDDANAISVHSGYQYQNVLHPQITKEIIDKVGEVEHVFSGDDHDYCEVVHRGFTSKGGGMREITVKSLSWAMGVQRPGFLLVSLWNPVDEHGRRVDTSSSDSEASSTTLQNTLCLLPDQLSIFIRYGILLAITTLVLAIQAFRLTTSRAQDLGDYSLLPLSNPSTPALDTKTRARADSNSYASSMTSTNAHGLAMRSNVGRSRSLSPAYGYGYSGPETYTSDTTVAGQNQSYLSGNLAPPPSKQFSLIDDSKVFTQNGGSGQMPASRSTKRWKAAMGRFLLSWCQVASVALLWYAWLAYTV